MTSLTATCFVYDVTVEHRRKSCYDAAELIQQQNSSYLDVAHVIHQDSEKMFIAFDWINDDISSGPIYIVGTCCKIEIKTSRDYSWTSETQSSYSFFQPSFFVLLLL
jgi:hypothetical protein